MLRLLQVREKRMENGDGNELFLGKCLRLLLFGFGKSGLSPSAFKKEGSQHLFSFITILTPANWI